jgi:hypothetical protein
LAADRPHYYACGPSVMLDTFEKACAALGYQHARIQGLAASGTTFGGRSSGYELGIRHAF